jgi:hypothetical protein
VRWLDERSAEVGAKPGEAIEGVDETLSALARVHHDEARVVKRRRDPPTELGVPLHDWLALADTAKPADARAVD